MDFGERPELIAFYADVVGELPQKPTTCFSRSPSVLPMWAHYASNLQGFVIEVDEEKLAKCFPESIFGDVKYQDKSSDAVADNLYRAYEIGKFRYMHLLRQSVFGAAYFTKQTCWGYEQERRMIVGETEIVKNDGVVLFDIPYHCIRSIISGSQASEEVTQALKKQAITMNGEFFSLKIGKSALTPYFFNSEEQPYVFINGAILPSEAHCAKCKEPIKGALECCSWCQINSSHTTNAAARNSYRMLAQYGMLDSYLEGVKEIDRGSEKS